MFQIKMVLNCINNLTNKLGIDLLKYVLLHWLYELYEYAFDIRHEMYGRENVVFLHCSCLIYLHCDVIVCFISVLLWKILFSKLFIHFINQSLLHYHVLWSINVSDLNHTKTESVYSVCHWFKIMNQDNYSLFIFYQSWIKRHF